MSYNSKIMSKSEFKDIKLLYVEDEDYARKYGVSYFNKLFDNIYEASNCKNALKIFEKQKPDIVITDIKMEENTGIDLIRAIRKKEQNTQIIVLSAFLDTKYLLDAIELNLVKYLTKPIKHDELFPALLQCVKNIKGDSSRFIYFCENLFFDSLKKNLIKNNESIILTLKEAELLDLLCKNRKQVVSYTQIENTIWHDDVMSGNALRLVIKKLRKKLPSNALENIPKVGYKLKCL